jgi:DNA repair ATPase RecN
MSKERDYYVAPKNERCGYEWDLGILNNQYLAGMITSNEYAVEINKMLYNMHQMIVNEILDAEEDEENTLDTIEELRDEVWDLENDKDDLEESVNELEEVLREIKDLVEEDDDICKLIEKWERDNYKIL